MSFLFALLFVFVIIGLFVVIAVLIFLSRVFGGLLNIPFSFFQSLKAKWGKMKGFSKSSPSQPSNGGSGIDKSSAIDVEFEEVG